MNSITVALIREWTGCTNKIQRYKVKQGLKFRIHDVDGNTTTKISKIRKALTTNIQDLGLSFCVNHRNDYLQDVEILIWYNDDDGSTVPKDLGKGPDTGPTKRLTIQQHIEVAAYYNWVNSGRPHGTDQDDWVTAESQVMGSIKTYGLIEI